MPRMNVGDRVRYIDDQFHLAGFFSKGNVYTVATSELLWPDGLYHTNLDGERVFSKSEAKKFTFVEVPGYTWICDHFFEDVVD